MAKINVGEQMENFVFDTPYKRGMDLETVVGGKKTGLLFSRYYGCSLCRYDMIQLKEQYEKITATGGQVVFVLQSDPDLLARNFTENEYPFWVIADPEQKIYKALSIDPATSIKDAIDEKALKKIQAARKLGLEHGEYEGNEDQLPAAFVIEPDLTVSYAHYAKTAGDIPDVDEFAALLAKKCCCCK